ncbi:MAG TPA: hypothetical protein VFD85_00235 [Gemmatimonadales bacterium]|nr:hypothetical protein [Gemmatimonadales bacterium]
MSRARRLALVVGLLSGGLVVGSCDRTPVAPVTPPVQSVPDVRSDWFGWSLNLLLTCSPLPFDSASQVIGPDGGAISVGPHTLTVPAGALTAPTLITAVVDPDSVNAVRFSPQGLVFQRPAQLAMSYANCGFLGAFIPKRIAYTTDDFRILEIIPSLDNVLNRTVTGRVSHFSQYAIAW